MAGKPNIPLAITTACILVFLFFLRFCSLTTWILLILVPGAMYAYLAERTKATPINGSVVLVTGSSSGLGKALALECARRGAKQIILVSRTRSKLEAVAKECENIKTNSSFSAHVVPCDLTDPTAIKEMAEMVTKQFGAIDILINNAGAGEWKHLEDTTPEEALGMMACPYQAAIGLSALLVPKMVEAKTGHIMNITSAVSLIAIRGALGYASSRWAVRGFTRSLFYDMKELNIGVTLLNAAEIHGTDYFKDSPGKAGGSSKDRIPSMFQLVDKIGINYNTNQVAVAGLDGIENGWMEVLIPHYLLLPMKVLIDIVPCFADFLCSVGPAGIRKKSQ